MAKIDLPKRSGKRSVWKTVESQGKVSEKSGNFENDIEWQPWYCFRADCHFLMALLYCSQHTKINVTFPVLCIV